jgi:hypothetical protein
MREGGRVGALLLSVGRIVRLEAMESSAAWIWKASISKQVSQSNGGMFRVQSDKPGIPLPIWS